VDRRVRFRTRAFGIVNVNVPWEWCKGGTIHGIDGPVIVWDRYGAAVELKLEAVDPKRRAVPLGAAQRDP
jgi:hypothetical protein